MGKIGDWEEEQLDRRVRQLLTNQNLPKRLTGTTFKSDTVEVTKELKLPKDVVDGRSLSYNIGTSPPAYPKEGDIWLYEGSGFVWQFVYRPTGDPTYPWFFVGGPPTQGFTNTGRSTNSGGFRPDPDMEVTLPRAGWYSVSADCRVVQAPNAGLPVGWDWYVAYRIGTSGAWTMWADTYTAYYFQTPGNGVTWSTTLSFQNTIGGFGSPDYRLRFHAAGLLNWDYDAYQRRISALPIRVA